MVDHILINKADEKALGGGAREEVWCTSEG